MSTGDSPTLAPAKASARANRIADLFAPATVVLFSGCGGTCIGIEQAYVDGGFTDKYVDLAINHWDTAVGVHELNHPMTQHLRGDVREIDPDSVLPGRHIAYLHASPDCTHFSRARGSKPKKKEIRGLAWVVVDWAKKRRPDVISLENVEEFRSWGPLAKNGQPCHRRRGSTYRQWVKALRDLGYDVGDRELRACDYGAPTTRKRLFVIAQRDGRAIVWPEKTHGIQEDGKRRGRRNECASSSSCFPPSEEHGRQPAGRRGVGTRRRVDGLSPTALGGSGRPGQSRGIGAGAEAAPLIPFRTAAECIDWSIPMLSIFATPEQASAWAARLNVGHKKEDRVGVPRRPLKPKTLQRIARGLVKWVIQAKRPYIVDIENSTWATDGTRAVDAPLNTVTATPKGGKHAAVDVTLAPYTVPNLGEREGQAPRSASVEQPMPTVTSKGNGARLVAATLAPFASTLNHGGEEHRSQSLEVPLATVTGANDARAIVAALITKHYGDRGQRPASGMDEPVGTVTSCDHNALTVAYLSHFYTSNTAGGHGDPEYPAKCITSGGQHAAVTVALMERSCESVQMMASSALTTSAEEAERASERVTTCSTPANGADESPAPTARSTADASQRSPTTSTTKKASAFTVGAGGPVYAGKPRSIDEPLGTVMVNDRRAIVAAFLQTYYGNSKDGHSPSEPMPTVVSKDRIGLVTVVIDDQTYVITDIAMRMLTPRELLLAQGFPADYRVDRTSDGKRVSKADQVKLIGNAVPPPFVRAIAYANVVAQGVLGTAPRRRKAVAS